MSWLRSWRLSAICALAGLTVVGALAALVSLKGGGALQTGGPALFPIAAGYDRAAVKLLEDSGTPSPQQLRRAAAASRAAIAQYPYDIGAWIRLAELDRQEHGQLTPEGVAALQKSYDLVAVDPDFGVLRIAVAAENSQRLPTDLWAAAHNETEALWKVPSYRRRIVQVAREVQNRPGRLALFIWVNRLRRQEAK